MENIGEQPDLQDVEQEHEGEKYLRMLGMESLADETIVLGDRTLQGRDFLELCGNHARPLLKGYETLAEDDPRREPIRNALRGMMLRFIPKPEGE